MNLFANLPTSFPMNLSIEILLSGFLGYWVASGGNRAKYSALYIIIGVLLFAVIGVATQQMVYLIFHPVAEVPSLFIFATPLVAAVSCGVLWRWQLGRWVFSLLNLGGITSQSFGSSNTWANFAFNANWRWFFIRVTLLDGTVLECNQVENSKNNIPELSTDEEDNLLFVATGKWDKNKSRSEPLKPTDEYGHPVFTYIPASQIVRADVHTKRKGRNRSISLPL